MSKLSDMIRKGERYGIQACNRCDYPSLVRANTCAACGSWDIEANFYGTTQYKKHLDEDPIVRQKANAIKWLRTRTLK